MEKTYNTREVADTMNVSIYQIYSWENLGKIKSLRTTTNRRYFTQQQVDRLRSTKNLKFTHAPPLKKQEPIAPVVHPVVSQNYEVVNPEKIYTTEIPSGKYYTLSETLIKLKIGYRSIGRWEKIGILTPFLTHTNHRIYDVSQVDSVAKYKNDKYPHLSSTKANREFYLDTAYKKAIYGKVPAPDMDTEEQKEESSGPTPVAIEDAAIGSPIYDEYAATGSPIYDEHLDEYDYEEYVEPLVDDVFPADKYYKTVGVLVMLDKALETLKRLVKKGTLAVFTDSRNYNYYLKEQVDALCGRSHFVSKRIKSMLTDGYLYPAIEIMARFGVARCTLTVWERTGALVPAYKKGRKVFYSESQINNFLKPKYGEGDLFFANVHEEAKEDSAQVTGSSFSKHGSGVIYKEHESVITPTNMVDEVVYPPKLNSDLILPNTLTESIKNTTKGPPPDFVSYALSSFIHVDGLPFLLMPLMYILKKEGIPDEIKVQVEVSGDMEQYCFLNGRCVIKPSQDVKVFSLDANAPRPKSYNPTTHIPGYAYVTGKVAKVTVEYEGYKVFIAFTAKMQSHVEYKKD